MNFSENFYRQKHTQTHTSGHHDKDSSKKNENRKKRHAGVQMISKKGSMCKLCWLFIVHKTLIFI